MSTTITIDHTKINPIAMRHFPTSFQSAIAEGVALVTAASKLGRPITDEMIVDWKASRGIGSSLSMANAKTRERYLKFAREILSTID